MRSNPSKMRGRSCSGMPMMSPITVIGSASATSSIQSPLPRASRSSIIRDARARMPSSSLAIARGVKALEMSFRCLLCSGGSSVMIVGYDANRSAGWISGPFTAVNDSWSRCSRTACRCLVVIQKSRLTVFATPGVSPWRNSGLVRRSSVNTSSGKPLRHNAKSDRSTVEAVIRNLDSSSDAHAAKGAGMLTHPTVGRSVR